MKFSNIFTKFITLNLMIGLLYSCNSNGPTEEATNSSRPNIISSDYSQNSAEDEGLLQKAPSFIPTSKDSSIVKVDDQIIIQGFNGDVNTIEAFGNGSKLVGGDFSSYNQLPANYIAKISNEGILDTKFSKIFNKSFDGPVKKIIVLENQDFLIIGDFSNYKSFEANRIIYFYSDRSVNENFLNNIGAGPNGPIDQITFQDSHFHLIGDFDEFNSNSVDYYVKLTLQGEIEVMITESDLLIVEELNASQKEQESQIEIYSNDQSSVENKIIKEGESTLEPVFKTEVAENSNSDQSSSEPEISSSSSESSSEPEVSASSSESSSQPEVSSSSSESSSQPEVSSSSSESSSQPEASSSSSESSSEPEVSASPSEPSSQSEVSSNSSESSSEPEVSSSSSESSSEPEVSSSSSESSSEPEVSSSSSESSSEPEVSSSSSESSSEPEVSSSDEDSGNKSNNSDNEKGNKRNKLDKGNKDNKNNKSDKSDKSNK